MPIVVNPGFVWPPEVDPVVSPDGRITAIVDPAHAGVLLRANYSDMTPAELGGSIAKRPAEWEMKNSGSFIVDYSSSPDGKAIRFEGSSSPASYGPMMPTAPGDVWNVEAVVDAHEGATSDINVRIYFYTAASAYIMSIMAMDGYGHISGSVTAPEGAVYARYGCIADGQPSPGWLAIHSMRGEREGDRQNAVAKVRFERQDGTFVRSGNPAWAPGGYAHAYDHEATLGGGTLWRAVPIMFDGTEGTPSEYVGAVIPALSDGWAWLKPVSDPDKAMLLKVEPPDLSYDGRVDTTSITGSSKPAATWDVLEGFTTQLRSLVREKTVADQLMALLDEGPVLAQFPDCAGLPDFYFIRGGVNLEHVHWDGYPWRRYQWDVISVDRPDTTDSPLRIPGLSYNTVERDWTTYDQLAATVHSYDKLLEP